MTYLANMSTGALVAQTLWEQPAIVCSDLSFTLMEMEPISGTVNEAKT